MPRPSSCIDYPYPYCPAQSGLTGNTTCDASGNTNNGIDRGMNTYCPTCAQRIDITFLFDSGYGLNSVQYQHILDFIHWVTETAQKQNANNRYAMFQFSQYRDRNPVALNFEYARQYRAFCQANVQGQAPGLFRSCYNANRYLREVVEKVDKNSNSKIARYIPVTTNSNFTRAMDKARANIFNADAGKWNKNLVFIITQGHFVERTASQVNEAMAKLKEGLDLIHRPTKVIVVNAFSSIYTPSVSQEVSLNAMRSHSWVEDKDDLFISAKKSWYYTWPDSQSQAAAKEYLRDIVCPKGSGSNW